jgi:hypothetical protein
MPNGNKLRPPLNGASPPQKSFGETEQPAFFPLASLSSQALPKAFCCFYAVISAERGCLADGDGGGCAPSERGVRSDGWAPLSGVFARPQEEEERRLPSQTFCHPIKDDPSDSLSLFPPPSSSFSSPVVRATAAMRPWAKSERAAGGEGRMTNKGVEWGRRSRKREGMRGAVAATEPPLSY